MEETLQNAATTRVFHNTLHINKLEHQLQMRHPAHRNRERTQLLASLQAGLSHAAASPHDGFIFTTHSYSSTS